MMSRSIGPHGAEDIRSRIDERRNEPPVEEEQWEAEEEDECELIETRTTADGVRVGGEVGTSDRAKEELAAATSRAPRSSSEPKIEGLRTNVLKGAGDAGESMLRELRFRM